MKSYDGKNIAENITITEQPASPKPDNLVARHLTEQLKMLQNSGIFFRMQGAPDGLLHKNSLPNNLKNSFKEVFTQSGQKVKVKIEKVTEKGIQLKLVDNV